MAKKIEKMETKTEAPKGKKVPKEFRIDLTEAQILERARAAAKLDQELEEEEKQFKEEETEWKTHKAAYKNKVKNLTESRRKLSGEIEAKQAMITDNVILVLNHDTGCAEYHYNFPNKGWQIVETRPLEDNERQLSVVTEEAEKMSDEGQEINE